jgi:hypothetical protein
MFKFLKTCPKSSRHKNNLLYAAKATSNFNAEVASAFIILVLITWRIEIGRAFGAVKSENTKPQNWTVVHRKVNQ